MKLVVNGNLVSVEAVGSIGELLVILDLQGKGVAVELNGQIVPEHDRTQIGQLDQFEIVVAVGGGLDSLRLKGHKR
jgi:sulfur carrier protein